jgi:hypothetical protein
METALGQTVSFKHARSVQAKFNKVIYMIE